MSRFAYVAGKFIPFAHGTTHIEDRGYQFADSVYEVIAVVNKKLVDAKGHLDRLERSLNALKIPHPLHLSKLDGIMNELIHLNRYRDGFVYIQISRGIAPRAFPFPQNPISRLTLTMRPMKQIQTALQNNKGVKVITMEDQRWARVDIKTTNLLPAVLAKQAAFEAGAFEAVFVKNDVVLECSSANIFAVIGGVLRTHPITPSILNGITRDRILAFCKEKKIPFEEKAFTVSELYDAEEAFITSANVLAIPITQVNNRIIGGGKPGKTQQQLQDLYVQFAQG